MFYFYSMIIILRRFYFVLTLLLDSVINSHCFVSFVWWNINLCVLFNGKTFRVEKQQCYYLTRSTGIKGFIPFPSSRDNNPQSSSCTDTSHPPGKLSKLDEPDMRDTAGEVGTSSWMMYSCGPLHMDEQRLDVQFEPTYSSSVPIRDVALGIGRKQ